MDNNQHLIIALQVVIILLLPMAIKLSEYIINKLNLDERNNDNGDKKKSGN